MATHYFDINKAKAFHNHFLMKHFPRFLNKSHDEFLSFVSQFNENAFHHQQNSVKDIFQDFCEYRKIKRHIARGYEVYSLGINHRFFCAEHNAQILDYSKIKTLADLSLSVERTKTPDNEDQGYYIMWNDGINEKNEHFGIIFTSTKQHIAFESENYMGLIQEFLDIDVETEVFESSDKTLDIRFKEYFNDPKVNKNMKGHFFRNLINSYREIFEDEINKALIETKPIYAYFDPSSDRDRIQTDIKHFIFKDIETAKNIDLIESTNFSTDSFPNTEELLDLCKTVSDNVKARFWPIMQQEFDKIIDSNIKFADTKQRDRIFKVKF